jgi:hypothetical protein
MRQVKEASVGRLGWWKKACAVCVLCAAASNASTAQTFTTLDSFEYSNGREPFASLVQAASVIFEVVNRHFTVGKKIPSIYLRVFADGTAECHTEKYWDEPDVVKTKVLGHEDLDGLKVLLKRPELLGIKHRYELMYPVIDSWMEWNIKIHRGGEVQIIEVAGFSPAAAKGRNQPYPDVLVKLGCSIWKLRSEVYGDEQATRAYHSEECNAAFAP